MPKIVYIEPGDHVEIRVCPADGFGANIQAWNETRRKDRIVVSVLNGDTIGVHNMLTHVYDISQGSDLDKRRQYVPYVPRHQEEPQAGTKSMTIEYKGYDIVYVSTPEDDLPYRWEFGREGDEKQIATYLREAKNAIDALVVYPSQAGVWMDCGGSGDT